VDVDQNAAFVLFSAVSPILIAFIKQSGWSTQVNAMIALACYIVIGIAGAVVSGQPLTLENAVNLITVATVVGSAAYGLIWSQIGRQTDADPGFDSMLTEKTSVVK
jgi:predicted exporter